MSDEFTSTVAQRFPNTLNQRETIERPWDVNDTNIVPIIKRASEESRRDDVAERIDTLYSELRASLTIRSALEFDLRKANRLLDEVNRIKGEVEKIIEMLHSMEQYMKERIR